MSIYIKNFGRGTTRFAEGIIVSGSTDATYAIHASGSVEAEDLMLDKALEPGINFSIDGDARARISVNTSNNLVFHNQFANKHIVFKVNDADDGGTKEAFRIDGGVSEVVVNQGAESLVDFRVETNNKAHAIFTDGSTNRVLILSGGAGTSNNEASGPDVNFYVSGSTRSKGTNSKGTSLFGGDVVVSGTLSAISKHVVTVKYTATSDSDKKYVRWDSAGSNENPGVNNKWVAPVHGSLMQVVIRSTHTPGNTTLGFHRVADGTENFSATAIETQSVDLSSANTSAFINFTPAANFGPGDVIGFSVDPANAHGNVNITFVFELDFVS